MKKRLLVPALLVSISCIFIACNKENNNVAANAQSQCSSITYRSRPANSTTVTVDNVGEWHNYCLGELLPVSAIETNGLDLITSSFFTSASTISFTNYQMSIINSAIPFIYYKIKSDQFENCLAEFSSNASQNLSVTDAEALNELSAILMADYSSENAPFTALENDLTSFKTAYTGSNDLIIGTANVGIASSQFWQTYNSQNTYEDEIGDPQYNIPQADAAGYLIAWTKAWLIDGVSEPSDRIRAGMGGAFAGSSGKWLKDIFKF